MQDSRGNKKKVGIQDPGPLRWDRSLHQSSHHVRIKSFKVSVKSGPVPCPLSSCPGACWPVSMPCTRLPGSGSGSVCMCVRPADGAPTQPALSSRPLLYATLLDLSLLPSRMDKTERKKGTGVDDRRAGRQARQSQSPVRLLRCLGAWWLAYLHICRDTQL
jgi:hypothetical protein